MEKREVKKSLDNSVFIFVFIFTSLFILELYGNFFSLFEKNYNYIILKNLVKNLSFITKISFKSKLILTSFILFISLFNVLNDVPEKKEIIKKTFVRVLLSLTFSFTAVICYSFADKSNIKIIFWVYVFFSILGYSFAILGFKYISYLIGLNKSKHNISSDKEILNGKGFKGGFMQEEKLIENDLSINLKTEFWYRGKLKKGCINVINGFRACLVMGVPGSGKSFSIIEQFHRQWIRKYIKGIKTSMVVFDAKFPTLSKNLYNYYTETKQEIEKLPIGKRTKLPVFNILSFTHPSISKRCNVFKYVSDSAGAIELATSILISLNRKMAEQKGEFFTESAFSYTGILISFLKLYKGGKYCTFPHMLQLSSLSSEEIFPVLGLYSIFVPDLETKFSSFEGPWLKEVWEQLEGQIGSARIGLVKIANNMTDWVMTEDELNPNRNATLDVNNPLNPQILCLGSDGGEKDPNIILEKPSEDKKNMLYSACISSYMTVIVNLINQEHKLPCMFSVDELPQIYINGLNSVIETGRSNKIFTLLGIQDLSQLTRDYGNKLADALNSTIANIFSGTVKGKTAQELSKSFGQKEVINQTENRNETKTSSVTYSKETKIPVDEIESLTQGYFVGKVADNFGEESSYKEFYAKVLVDNCTTKSVIEPLYSKEELMYLPHNIVENTRKISSDIKNILVETELLKNYSSNLKKRTLNLNILDNSDIVDFSKDVFDKEYWLQLLLVEEESDPENPLDFILSEEIENLSIFFYSSLYICQNIELPNYDIVSEFQKKKEQIGAKISSKLNNILLLINSYVSLDLEEINNIDNIYDKVKKLKEKLLFINSDDLDKRDKYYLVYYTLFLEELLSCDGDISKEINFLEKRGLDEKMETLILKLYSQRNNSYDVMLFRLKNYHFFKDISTFNNTIFLITKKNS